MADRIRARGKPKGGAKERVSVRTVRKELGGGSHEGIGPSLSRWKARRDYQPVVEEAGLPLALQGVLAEWQKLDSMPQLVAELGTDLGRGMLALVLTAGLPLPLQSAVRLTVETLEQLLIRLPGEDASLPEQRLGQLIARQVVRQVDLPL